MDATQGFLLLSHLPALYSAKSISAFIQELQQLFDYSLSEQLSTRTLYELLLAAEFVKLTSKVATPRKESRLEPVETVHFGVRLAKQVRPFLYLVLMCAFGRRSWLALLACIALDVLAGNQQVGVYFLRHPLYYWITKRFTRRIKFIDAIVDRYQRFITNTV